MLDKELWVSTFDKGAARVGEAESESQIRDIGEDCPLFTRAPWLSSGQSIRRYSFLLVPMPISYSSTPQYRDISQKSLSQPLTLPQRLKRGSFPCQQLFRRPNLYYTALAHHDNHITLPHNL